MLNLPRVLRMIWVLLATLQTLRAQSPQAELPLGETLERQLLREDPQALAREARRSGDVVRGAILFHQPFLLCTRCHTAGEAGKPLGPDLAKPDLTQPKNAASEVYLIDSLLSPSKTIRKGFEPIVVATTDGKTLTGLLLEKRADGVVLRDVQHEGKSVTILTSQIDEMQSPPISIMPAGLVNQLGGRQQFLDLACYLIEIAEKGPARALELRPAPSLYAPLPLPEYEARIDHAGMIAEWNRESYKRGEAIYDRLCINCHGTHAQAGSLPTSLRFATGKFKNGSDPFAMYQTLTRGFGLMAPQHWMVPQQKYDVIHYLREAYLKEHNPTQLAAVDAAYLAKLPKGDTSGPKPSTFEPWVAADYGPSLINTYEVANGNFAYKGVAMRLDPGPGGISRGKQWAMFDHDTLRFAAAWSGSGFIDWNGIHFNGRHQVHPKLTGEVQIANPVGPGWADPKSGSFDDPRVRGRDGRCYGPLPRHWAHYKGLYHYGQQTIVSYRVGEANVLETTGYELDAERENRVIYSRTLNIGPSGDDLHLRVAPDGVAVALVGRSVGGPPAKTGEPPVLRVEAGYKVLRMPAAATPLSVKLLMSPNDQAALDRFAKTSPPPTSLEPMTHGGPPRWPQVLKTEAVLGSDAGPLALDVLTHPASNPWLCQMRFTGLDFSADGREAFVCAWDGDVWRVSGVDQPPPYKPAAQASASGPVPIQHTRLRFGLEFEQPAAGLAWQRIASGLFQPLGIKLVKGMVYVTCRDQIVVLHDLNGDGESDYYENFNNDHQVTEHFHEFAMGLQTDAAGNFYYAKSARHALPAVVPHHGTLLRVSPDGQRTDILATGFRAANGVCLNPDGSFFVTDQEGHWNPKNRINHVHPGGFYGNMFGYHWVTDSSDAAMQPPLCWITNSFDRSPAELLWVDSAAWGPLKGSLLNFSYGYGKIFIVPHEQLAGQMQGGMCELPLPQLPTGIMRGRFHPTNGQLYACGMFAWAGNQTQPGGLYRVRYTGKAIYVPRELHAKSNGMAMTFTAPLDRARAANAANYAVKTWSLKRTAEYGSKHYDEKPLTINKATLSEDGQTVFLEMPDVRPTWCMEIKFALQAADGTPVSGTIHNTVHRLGE